MHAQNGLPETHGTLSEKLKLFERALRDASCQLEEKVQELSIMRRVIDIAGHLYDLNRFFKSFADILMEETKAMNCSLMELDNKRGLLHLRVARGRNDDGTFFDYPFASPGMFALGEGIAGVVAQHRETVLLDDAGLDRRFEVRESRFPVKSLICTPLVFNKEVLGVVNLSHPEARAFTKANKLFMEMLCDFVSHIIGNARIHIMAQQKMRDMFEGMPISIIIVDPSSLRIIDCNAFTEQCIEYTRQELIQIGNVCDLVASEYRDGLTRLLDFSSQAERPEFYEVPLIRKNGQLQIFEINICLTSFLAQDVIRIMLIDTTEKRRMREQLFQTEKLRSLGELASGVAHDFNNVLAAILGRVQLLRTSLQITDSDVSIKNSQIDFAKNLDIIEKAALDGTETIRRIQEFARSRTEEKLSTPVDLNSLVDDAVEFTRVRWRDISESQGTQIHVLKMQGDIENVGGSASELREVMINLINNAADAMPHGGTIRISTFMRRGLVTLKIEDTGVGIHTEIIGKIFDPFFTTKDIRSSGLGLSVSYGIISRHKGTITVESPASGGACFTISLPVCPEAAQKNYTEQMVVPQRSARILVIEDEQSVSETLREILLFAGHEVTTVPNGTEGLSSFDQDSFDIVITDLGMPGVSGFDVARSVKQRREKTPDILITGWELQLKKQDLQARGIDFLINKPFQMNQVLNTVQEALGSQA
jgi:signal transduction histidine kinase/ActR/RegA family two-component response regulator